MPRGVQHWTIRGFVPKGLTRGRLTCGCLTTACCGIRKSRWRVLEAETCRQGLTGIRSHPVAVVVCERDLPDGTWKVVLDELAQTPGAPLLIVASHLADNALWAEVLNMGGYDVLLNGAFRRSAFASSMSETRPCLAVSRTDKEHGLLQPRVSDGRQLAAQANYPLPGRMPASDATMCGSCDA